MLSAASWIMGVISLILLIVLLFMLKRRRRRLSDEIDFERGRSRIQEEYKASVAVAGGDIDLEMIRKNHALY